VSAPAPLPQPGGPESTGAQREQEGPDPRVALAGLALLSLLLSLGGAAALPGVALLLASLTGQRRLRPLPLLRELSPLLPLLGLLFGLRLLPGLQPEVALGALALAAALDLARIVLLLYAAALLQASYSSHALQRGLQGVLAPLGAERARRVALQLVLLLALLPRLRRDARALELAARARGARPQRPWRWLQATWLPLLRRSLLGSRGLSLALLARGFDRAPASRPRPLPLRSWLPLLPLLLALLLACWTTLGELG